MSLIYYQTLINRHKNYKKELIHNYVENGENINYDDLSETFGDYLNKKYQKFKKFVKELDDFYKIIILYAICFVIFLFFLNGLVKKANGNYYNNIENINTGSSYYVRGVDNNDMIVLNFLKLLNNDQRLQFQKLEYEIFNNENIKNNITRNDNLISLVNYVFFKEMESNFINKMYYIFLNNKSEIHLGKKVSDYFEEYKLRWIIKNKSIMDNLIPYNYVYDKIFQFDDYQSIKNKIQVNNISLNKLFFMHRLNDLNLINEEMKKIIKKINNNYHYMHQLLDNCRWNKNYLLEFKKSIIESLQIDQIILSNLT